MKTYFFLNVDKSTPKAGEVEQLLKTVVKMKELSGEVKIERVAFVYEDEGYYCYAEYFVIVATKKEEDLTKFIRGFKELSSKDFSDSKMGKLFKILTMDKMLKEGSDSFEKVTIT